MNNKFLILFIGIVVCSVLAQPYMVVRQKDNVVTRFPVESIDSVFFYEKNSIDDLVDYDDYAPSLVSTYAASKMDSYDDIYVEGNDVYAIGTFGLRKFDWNNPSVPRLVFEDSLVPSLSLKGRSITGKGDYLYIVMRTANVGFAEKYSPDLRIFFESNIANVNNGPDSLSTNSIMNKFFKELHVASFDARTIDRAYLYPSRYENGAYRNVIMLKSRDGKTIRFVRKDYATKEASLLALKSKYVTSMGDSCVVDWNVLSDNGVVLKNLEIFSSTGSKKILSDNTVLNSFFKSLQISSINQNNITSIVLYKAFLENGAYKNIVRLNTSDSHKEIEFLNQEFDSEEKALANLYDSYKTSKGDFCSVDWSTLDNGRKYTIKNFKLFTYGAFSSYKYGGGAKIDESAIGSPNYGLHAAKITSGNADSSYAIMSRKLDDVEKIGEISLWIKNIKPLNDKVEIPVLSLNGKNVALIELFPSDSEHCSLGMRASLGEGSVRSLMKNLEWYNIKLKLYENQIELYYRSLNAENWHFHSSMPISNVTFDEVVVGIQTKTKSAEIHIDDLFFSKKNLDSNAYVNGKLVVLNKKTLKIEQLYNLDLKGTGSAIIGNALVVALMGGFNVYDVSNPAEPRLVKWYRPSSRKEFQQCVSYRHNGRNYVVICNYSSGYTIVDVTDLNNVTVVKEEGYFGSTYENVFLNKKSRNYGVAVKYPYLYFTHFTERDYAGTDKDLRGIVVVNISDLDNTTKKFVGIPAADISTNKKGYPCPTRVVFVKNRLLLNNGDKGIAVMDVSDPANPVYKKTVEISGASSVYSITYSNGNVFVGEENGGGTSKKGLYLYTGF